MKTIIRAFVIVLALTGAVASTQTSAASARTIASSVQPKMMPVPTCPPTEAKATAEWAHSNPANKKTSGSESIPRVSSAKAR